VIGAELRENEYTIKPLDPETWDALAQLAERHNGFWHGCWCTGSTRRAPSRRPSGAVAWCEYGTVDEPPNVYHRKEYEQGVVRTPDYRLTCLFVDTKYRRKGVVAVRGALALIGRAGGGLVQAHPQEQPWQEISASFLYNSTRSRFR